MSVCKRDRSALPTAAAYLVLVWPHWSRRHCALIALNLAGLSSARSDGDSFNAADRPAIATLI